MCKLLFLFGSEQLCITPLMQMRFDNNKLPNFLVWMESSPGSFVLNAVAAIAILIVGWLFATLASLIVRGLLKRTQIDNRLAAAVFGQAEADSLPVEKWAAQFVYYLILLFVLVAFLNALQLTAVSEPLNAFLNRIFGYLPQLGGAIAWLVGGWLLATIAKLVLTRSLQSFQLDTRLAAALGNEGDSGSPLLLNENLGKIVYWFVLLLFLYFALSALGLDNQLEPIQSFLTRILEALPQILAAGLIGLVGWAIARIARTIISNLLVTTGIDRFGANLGLTGEAGRQSLSSLFGTLSYAAILVLTAIAALEELDIQAISEPAIAALNQVLVALPRILTAIGILAGAYLVGRFIAEWVTNILTSIGFNNVLTWLGLPSPDSTPPSDSPPETAQATEAGSLQKKQRTPSEIVGLVALVSILLLAVIAVGNLLEFEELTTLVAGFSVIFARIIAGAVVFAIGLYLANLAFNLIRSPGSRQARLLAQAVRIVIIGFVAAMALQQIGIAPNIVNLAFGLIGGAVAVAFAIAFGIGGRDVAAETIRFWLEDFKRPD